MHSYDPMLRSVEESLHQPADHDMPLSALARELVDNLGMLEEPTEALLAQLQAKGMTCVAHLSGMDHAEFNTMVAGTLNPLEVDTLCMCLGAAGSPHVFKAPTPTPLTSHSVSGFQSLMAPEDVTLGLMASKKKGGSKTEVAEILHARRAALIMGAYYPPACFDVYHKNSTIPRSYMELRKLVVQEVHAVCGDLYPDKNEREVILRTIELFCGPPAHGKHWDNWNEVLSGKKHKGAAVGDLEKARRDASTYGVSTRAMHGRMRPARPQRFITGNYKTATPASAVFFSEEDDQEMTQPEHGQEPVQPVSAREVPLPEPPDSALDHPYGLTPVGLLSEEEVKAQVKAMEAQLAQAKAVHAQKVKEKEAQAAAQKAKKAAEKKAQSGVKSRSSKRKNPGDAPPDDAATADATAAAVAASLLQRCADTVLQNAAADDDGVPVEPDDAYGEPVEPDDANGEPVEPVQSKLCAYELEIQQTVKRNKEMLKLMEDLEKNENPLEKKKILPAEDAMSLFNAEEGSLRCAASLPTSYLVAICGYLVATRWLPGSHLVAI